MNRTSDSMCNAFNAMRGFDKDASEQGKQNLKKQERTIASNRIGLNDYSSRIGKSTQNKANILSEGWIKHILHNGVYTYALIINNQTDIITR